MLRNDCLAVLDRTTPREVNCWILKLVLVVVVLVPHRRLNLGPARLPRQLQAFLDGVLWLSLEEFGQQADLDPLLALLTLPVLP